MTIDDLVGLYQSLQKLNPQLKLEGISISDKQCKEIAKKTFISSEPQKEGLSKISLSKKPADIEKFVEACKTIQSIIKLLSLDDKKRPQLAMLIRLMNHVIDNVPEAKRLCGHITLQAPEKDKSIDLIKRIPIPHPPQETPESLALRGAATRITEKIKTLEGFYNKTLSEKESLAVDDDEAFLVFDIENDLEEIESQKTNFPPKVKTTRENARRALEEYKKRASFMALAEKKETLLQSIAKKGLKSVNDKTKQQLETIFAKEAVLVLYSPNAGRRAQAAQKLAILYDAIAKVPNFRDTFFQGIMLKLHEKIEQLGPSIFFPQIATKAQELLQRATNEASLFDLRAGPLRQLNDPAIKNEFLKAKQKLYSQELQKEERNKIASFKQEFLKLDDREAQFQSLVKTAEALKVANKKLEQNPSDAASARQLDNEFALWSKRFRAFNSQNIFKLDDFDLRDVETNIAQSEWAKTEAKQWSSLFENKLKETEIMTDVGQLRVFLDILKEGTLLSVPYCIRSDAMPTLLAEKLNTYNRDTQNPAFHKAYIDLTNPPKKSAEELFQGEYASFAQQIQIIKDLGTSFNTFLSSLPDDPIKKKLHDTLYAISLDAFDLFTIVPFPRTKQIPNLKDFLKRQKAFLENIENFVKLLPEFQRYVQTCEKDKKTQKQLRQICEELSPKFLSDPFSKENPPSALLFPGTPGQRTIPAALVQTLTRMEMLMQRILTCHSNTDDRQPVIEAVLATHEAIHNVNELLRT